MSKKKTKKILGAALQGAIKGASAAAGAEGAAEATQAAADQKLFDDNITNRYSGPTDSLD